MIRPLVVAGSGRCGSSLTMQMLAAGGVPTTGTAPAFEDVALCERYERNPRALRYADGAVKMLVPFVSVGWLVKTPATDFIWVTRDVEQMARSQEKFARLLLGVEYSRPAGRRLRRALASENVQLPSHMVAPHRCLVVRFEDLLAEPTRQAERIATYLDTELDVAAMASVVVPRDADCLRGLLELVLDRGTVA